MTNKQKMICVREMDAYTDKDAYISDLSLSSMWGDAEDSEIPPERIIELSRLWDVIHGGIKGVSRRSGMSCRSLAERFSIPYRTVENWSAGVADPAPYVLLMMDEILGAPQLPVDHDRGGWYVDDEQQAIDLCSLLDHMTGTDHAYSDPHTEDDALSGLCDPSIVGKWYVIL